MKVRHGVTAGGLRAATLFVANADGSGAVPVASAPPSPCASPCPIIDDIDWSPDGRRVAFVLSCGCITGAATEIYVTNAGGTGSTQLTSRAAAGTLSHAYLSWSPDGRWLAGARTGADRS